MPNRHRGEVAACLNGQPHKLCLTLGALAELEQAFGDSDMLALTERFQSGRISALDATRILGAGLRGAGHILADDDIARMQFDHGAAGAVALVAELLAVTFGGPLAGVAVRTVSDMAQSAAGQTKDGPAPFPGPR